MTRIYQNSNIFLEKTLQQVFDLITKLVHIKDDILKYGQFDNWAIMGWPLLIVSTRLMYRLRVH